MGFLQVNGGSIEDKVDFAYNLFEQTVSVDSVFQPNEMLDTIAITKGKGTEGVVTRWGVTRLPRKTHRGLRKVSCTQCAMWLTAAHRPTVQLLAYLSCSCVAKVPSHPRTWRHWACKLPHCVCCCPFRRRAYTAPTPLSNGSVISNVRACVRMAERCRVMICRA